MQTMTPRRTDSHLALAERVRPYIDLHADEPLIPTCDDAARSEFEGERLPTLRGIKLLTVEERAGVLDGDEISLSGSRPLAND